MEKEKFSKEEIETAQFLYDKWGSSKYTSPTFKGFLNSLLKTETKFIDVRIEYKPIPDFITEEPFIDLSINDIRDSLNKRMNKEFEIKVTELPEVFSREDMICFLIDYASSYDPDSAESCLRRFLSERSKK